MSARLDAMISSGRERRVRELDASWDAARSERVREGALRRREGRVQRHRLVRRGLLVASGAGLLVLALLRAASSAPSVPGAPVAAASTAPSGGTASPPMAEALAAHTLSDAGYARD